MPRNMNTARLSFSYPGHSRLLSSSPANEPGVTTTTGSTVPALPARLFALPARLLAGLLVGLALAAAAPQAPVAAAPTASVECDALCTRVRSELSVFTGWLARHGASGFVGEVGWPDDTQGDARRWNALADRWYSDADRAGLWVAAWATGEWWHRSYPLAPYEQTVDPGPVDRPDVQAAVIEEHPTSAGVLRGVNVAGAEFGAPSIDPTSSFSNANPGTAEVHYHYDSQATFDFLAGRGIKLVRLPVRWERLQRAPLAELDPAELARLRAALGRAAAAGLSVALDVHNYGGYYLFDGTTGVRRALGTPELPLGALADLWARLSRALSGTPGLVAYGLMNEPVGLPSLDGQAPARTWERASQLAVDAVRAGGDRTTVLVAGYQWSGAQVWAEQHPAPWVSDPAGNVRYEAHHYWDSDHSGTYPRTYAQELATAEAAGFHTTVRLAGDDRYETAAAVSQATVSPGVAVAYVATGAGFPDALAAGPGAALDGAPVLLVTRDSVPPATADELRRIGPRRIVVLGGASAVSDDVVADLARFSAGGTSRLAGPDRFATAAAVSAARFTPDVGVAYVATGSAFPDALAAGPAAAADRGPLLLVARDSVPEPTAAELSRLRPGRIVVVGGPAAVSPAVEAQLAAWSSGGVRRVAGDDRYATAAALSAAAFPGPVERLWLATGLNFPDALAGAPAAGARRTPVLLVPGDCVPGATRSEIDRLRPSTLVVLGGTSSVGEGVPALAPCPPG